MSLLEGVDSPCTVLCTELPCTGGRDSTLLLLLILKMFSAMGWGTTVYGSLAG